MNGNRLTPELPSAGEPDILPLLSPSLPRGPLPNQEAAHETLGHLLRLHAHQVSCAAADEALVRPPHLWLSGPCGCGKSHLTREAAMRSGLPWIRADLSRYAVAGQPGRTLEWILQELADHSRGPAFDGNRGAVVILEGLDRETQPASGERARALQSELASILEGRSLPFRSVGRNSTASSRRVQFLIPFTTPENFFARRTLGFGPAAPLVPVSRPESGIQALREAGIHRCLLDVISACLPLPALDVADLASLLLYVGGGLAGTRRLLAEEGVQLELTPDAREWIAREAIALERGGHGLHQVLSRIAPPLVSALATLPRYVATVRITSDYLNGRQSSPECIAGTRRPVTTQESSKSGKLAPHQDFPPEVLPHRPTRPLNTGASSQGRLANLSDLKRWIQ